MSELSKLLNQFQKKFPKITREDSGIIKTIKMDSPQLNYLFGGGIPIGRIHRLRGPASGGKSTMSIYMAAQIQEKLPELLNRPSKETIVYVDFERTFSTKFAEQLGLDCTGGKFIHLLPDDIETAADILMELIKTDDIAAIIFDSDAAAPSRTMMSDPSGKANFGGGAKSLSEFIRKINILCANYDTTFFLISQERVNMQPMSHLPSVTGGEAPAFYASTINRVTKIDVIKDAVETIGQQIRVRNYKNKTATPFRDAEMNLYYKGGFKSEEEYLDFFIKFGIFKQGGAWYTNEEFRLKLNGRAKIQEWLNQNPEAFKTMKEKTDDLLSHETELDANNKDPTLEGDTDPEITEDMISDTPEIN
jgi:recombination protein RecA